MVAVPAASCTLNEKIRGGVAGLIWRSQVGAPSHIQGKKFKYFSNTFKFSFQEAAHEWTFFL